MEWIPPSTVFWPSSTSTPTLFEMTSISSSGNSKPEASFSSIRSRTGRIQRLTAPDLGAGLASAALFPFLSRALKRWGLGPVQTHLGSLPPGRIEGSSCADDLESARRIAWVVGLTARKGPWRPNCLERSLVLWWLLRHRRIPGELRIGVRRKRSATGPTSPTRPALGPDAHRPTDPQGSASFPRMSREMEFHAWVELHGQVLNDTQEIRRHFATFDQAIVPPGVSWS